MKESSGSGLFLLFIVFLILKLCGVINWSWWWVTCPLWVGLAICAAIFGSIFVVGLVVLVLTAIFNKRKTRIR